MNRKIKKYSKLLNNKKLYDENTHFLLCPKCNNYSLEYLFNQKKWSCGACGTIKESYYKSLVLLTDNDKYHIYNFWGVEALSQLTYGSLDETKEFVGSYFRKGCSSIGDKCIYFEYFREEELSEQIRSIENLFDKTRKEYGLLVENVEVHLKLFRNEKHFFGVKIQNIIEAEYIRLMKKIEEKVGILDDFLIVAANTDLSKDQKVFVKEHDGDLIADSNFIDGLELFVWNDVKKGDMVGVAASQINSFKELNQTFKNFSKKIDVLEKLSPLERKIYYHIASSEEGILQNRLWKKFKIDSSKCSRIIKSMIEKNLIIKESIEFSKTYRLSINK